MTLDTLRRVEPRMPALTVQAMRSGTDTQVRLSGHLMDSDLSLLDETVDWLIAAGALHIVVDTHELAGDAAVLSDWLGGYRQQCLVRRHVLSVADGATRERSRIADRRPVSRRRASR